MIAIGIGVAVNSMLGPQCAMLPELFGNRHRYLGVAMAREISAVLAGGLAGVLGAYLITVTHGNWLLLATVHGGARAHHRRPPRSSPRRRCGRDLTRIDDAVKISDDEAGEGYDVPGTHGLNALDFGCTRIADRTRTLPEPAAARHRDH